MKFLRTAAKYLISLGLGGGILWFLFKDLDLEKMLARLKEVDYSYIILSVVIAMVSHIFRAYRWNIMLEPLGYNLKTFRTTLAVMVGYVANLLVPRMGEVSRCGILNKTDNVPVSVSFGSVVAERIIDLMVLIIVVFAAFIIEYEKLKGFFAGFVDSNIARLGRNVFNILILTGIFLLAVIALFFIYRHYKSRIRNSAVFLKIRFFMRELADGLTSIRKVKNPTGFVVSTILIWMCYYWMAYVVVFALPETRDLDLMAGLSILALGSIGMAAPVQGGIGTYHALVAGILVLYGIVEEDGVLFATLLHTSQVVFIIVVGSLSFMISFLISRRNAKNDNAEEEKVKNLT